MPLLGRVYGQLLQRHSKGLEVSLGVLSDLTPEEMSHITGVFQRLQGPVNEAAFADCVRTVLDQSGRSKISSAEELLELRNKLKKSKGAKA